MNPKKLSPLAQAALSLDEEFNRLEQLGGELERAPIETDNGLDRARLLLQRFGETGERLGANIQALAQALAEAQARAQITTQAVAARAQLVQGRQNDEDRLTQRFQTLGQMVAKFNEAVTRLTSASKLSGEARDAFLKGWPELESNLGILIAEAQKIEAEAREVKMKTLERDANALAQSMQAMRGKLQGIAEYLSDLPPAPGPGPGPELS